MGGCDAFNDIFIHLRRVLLGLQNQGYGGFIDLGTCFFYRNSLFMHCIFVLAQWYTATLKFTISDHVGF